jgi:gas vesicle protein
MLMDFIATLAAIKKLDRHLNLINDLAMSIKELSDELAITIAGNTIELIETGSEIKEAIEGKKKYFKNSAKKKRETFAELTKKYESLISQKGIYTRLIKAFPDLKTSKYADSLQKLKEHAKTKK